MAFTIANMPWLGSIDCRTVSNAVSIFLARMFLRNSEQDLEIWNSPPASKHDHHMLDYCARSGTPAKNSSS